MLSVLIHGIGGDRVEAAAILKRALEASVAPFGFSESTGTLSVSVPVDVIATKDQTLVRVELTHFGTNVPDGLRTEMPKAVGAALEQRLSGARVAVAFSRVDLERAGYLTPLPTKPVLVVWEVSAVDQVQTAITAGASVVLLPWKLFGQDCEAMVILDAGLAKRSRSDARFRQGLDMTKLPQLDMPKGPMEAVFVAWQGDAVDLRPWLLDHGDLATVQINTSLLSN